MLIQQKTIQDFRRKKRWLTGIFCLVVILLVTTHLLLLFQKSAKRSEYFSVQKSNVEAFVDWSASVLTPIDKVYLDIGFKQLEKIKQVRQHAIDFGINVEQDNDYVNATLRHHNTSIPVKIRLKGVLPDHFKNDKWSFRVKTKGDHAFKGMKFFNIQAPETRGYQLEPVFLHFLKREDLLTVRYDFIDLYINGKRIGVMALEEHFAKQLLEHQQRKENPIFKFDASRMFQVLNTNSFASFSSWHTNPLTPFQASTIEKKPELQEQVSIARKIMLDLQYGAISPSEAINVESFAKLFALSYIWSAYHHLQWKDLRFYFDPFTHRFEPAVYDVNPETVFLTLPKDTVTGNSIINYFLSDPIIYWTCIKYIKVFSEFSYLAQAIKEMSALETDYLFKLYRDYAMLPRWNYTYLLQRAKNLQNIEKLTFYQPTKNPIAPSALTEEAPQLYDFDFIDILHTGRDLFTFVNPLAHDVRIDRVYDKNHHPLEVAPFEIKKIGLVNKIYHGSAPIASVDVTMIANQHTRNIAVTDYPLQLPIPLQQEQYPAFVVQNGDEVRIPTGTYTVEDHIRVRCNKRLYIEKGVTLLMSPHTQIFTCGPMIVHGTKNEPVYITSEKGYWGGLYVSGSKTKSELQHVHFKHVGVYGDRRLTGALTFYHTTVDLDHVYIDDVDSEDAINIVRSDFVIGRLTVQNTASDGVDIDFSEGHINFLDFAKIGGDSFDVSGSKITVDHLLSKGSQDKAISIGEASHVQMHEAAVENTAIAVASKDASFLSIASLTYQDIHYFPVMAYQKKPEYASGGEVHIQKMTTFQKVTDCDPVSKVYINDKKMRCKNQATFKNYLDYVESL
ncbi:MAG: hypothetical protein R3A45_02390 [Bdellovibrionota bacterium]